MQFNEEVKPGLKILCGENVKKNEFFHKVVNSKVKMER